jgi:CheY-like chemotaxis protein
VVSAANGRQALEILRAGAPPPTLILLDLMMPVMDGFQFCADRKEDLTLRNVPVLVMSASGQTENRLNGAHVQGYLKKPMTMETLLEMVERHRQRPR